MENAVEISKTQRSSWLDIARGIAIAFIAVGHYIPIQVRSIVLFRLTVFTLLSFHVPAFFIMAGYTTKLEDSAGKYIKKRFRELMIPWLFFTVLVAVIRLIDGSLQAKDLFSAVLRGNLANPASWFIPVIFIAQCLWFLFLRPFRNKGRKKVLVAMSLIAALFYIGGFFIYKSGIHVYFGAERVFYGVFFVAVGGIIAQLVPLQKASNISEYASKLCIAFLGAACLLINVVISSGYDFYFELAQMTFPNYWLFAFTGICGTIGIVLISMVIESNKLLECYGRNSLFICFTHEFLIGLFNNSGPSFRPLFSSMNTYYIFKLPRVSSGFSCSCCFTTPCVI